MCQATLDTSVFITSSNLTFVNLRSRFTRVRLLLVIRAVLSKVALQIKEHYILKNLTRVSLLVLMMVFFMIHDVNFVTFWYGLIIIPPQNPQLVLGFANSVFAWV